MTNELKEIIDNAEKLKFFAFYGISKKLFDSLGDEIQTIVDCCCGNSFLGWHWLVNDNSLNVLAVDNRVTNRFREVNQYFKQNFPNLSEKHSFIERDVSKIIFPESSLVVALHACGNLTDIIIEKCVDKRLPFAVMPCCPNSRRIWWKDKSIYFEGSLSRYIDNLRLEYMQKNGYAAKFELIDENITPMNRIILARPRK